jgi:hypothetical protein
MVRKHDGERTVDQAMSSSDTHRDHPVPRDALLFGYGSMIPFLAAATAAWTLPAPWPAYFVVMSIIWGALLLSFVAGVRRGYGFGNPGAWAKTEIVSVVAYVLPALTALTLVSLGSIASALFTLIIGFALVIACDRRAARCGNAPAYFLRLRGPQMSLAIVSLIALVVRVLEVAR